MDFKLASEKQQFMHSQEKYEIEALEALGFTFAEVESSSSSTKYTRMAISGTPTLTISDLDALIDFVNDYDMDVIVGINPDYDSEAEEGETGNNNKMYLLTIKNDIDV